MRICPICQRQYDEYPALSRKDNRTEICPDCGMVEAFESFGLTEKEAQKKVKEIMAVTEKNI